MKAEPGVHFPPSFSDSALVPKPPFDIVEAMEQPPPSDVKDDYPTCRETYVTFRAYHESAEPSDFTTQLGREPSSSQRVGEPWERRGANQFYPLSGWFLCSKDHVESYDSAKHLDWLLRELAPHHTSLEKLRSRGWRMDISCLWDSDAGHGGPTLPIGILRRLADLGVELWFDVYFWGAYQRIQHSKQAKAAQPNA